MIGVITILSFSAKVIHNRFGTVKTSEKKKEKNKKTIPAAKKPKLVSVSWLFFQMPIVETTRQKPKKVRPKDRLEGVFTCFILCFAMYQFDKKYYLKKIKCENIYDLKGAQRLEENFLLENLFHRPTDRSINRV